MTERQFAIRMSVLSRRYRPNDHYEDTLPVISSQEDLESEDHDVLHLSQLEDQMVSETFETISSHFSGPYFGSIDM